jgi:uncharacterized 2Fe-2S/4Fe-4S cluster protein (DUF4445 family)
MQKVVRGVVKIETATEARFQELFVAAMAFPHATASSPHLTSVLQMPERVSGGGENVRTARRRRVGI